MKQKLIQWQQKTIGYMRWSSVHHLKMAHTASEDLDGHMIACTHIFNFPRGWMLFEKTEKIWLFRRGSELHLDLHYHQEDLCAEQCLRQQIM